jgi:hypothetical protein
MGHVDDDLPFRVEQWDASGARLEQTLSASADLRLGRAAFAEAVHQRPGQRIVLRHTRYLVMNANKDALNSAPALMAKFSVIICTTRA